MTQVFACNVPPFYEQAHYASKRTNWLSKSLSDATQVLWPSSPWTGGCLGDCLQEAHAPACILPFETTTESSRLGVYGLPESQGSMECAEPMSKERWAPLPSLVAWDSCL